MMRSSQSGAPARRKRLGRTLRICGVLYLLVCAGCAGFQRRMIYFPPVFDAGTADQLGASEKLERWNDSSGKPIGWKRPSPVQPARGQVLILHGNGNAAVQCGHYPDTLQQIAPLDVFIVEYPGYADQPGAPTEKSLEAAAADALQSLETTSPIYLLGESLGTG